MSKDLRETRELVKYTWKVGEFQAEVTAEGKVHKPG